ncbi:M13 family metallopeptidase [Sphingomonas oligophenolica]|uniref:M13 family peptidase n=1 Tax=Sphingomonas oligophenolica TaxID=301154 RepID=A0A502CH76_9SPHN|nr:M13 family metallopeptidase [Sphingomonas oligophenolica]TPG11990.1 M13 family peptidase [Sphingomonas oligophenolica]
MKRLVLLAALLASTAIAQDAPIGIDTTAIDRSVKPGDDFDAYASGAWRARTEIPADRSSTGVFLTVFKKAEAANAAIIKTAGAANAAAGTDQRRIADYYAAFMDTAGIEARGMAPVQADLAAIAALKDKQQLSAMLGANLRADEDPINATSLGTENLFGLFVTQALTKPDETVPYVLQGGLGMPDRDYYLSTAADMVAIRTAYRAYVEQLLTLAGVSDAAARADRIVALETKIAKAHADVLTTNQMSQGHDPWSKADFAAKAPGIDWDAYWRAAGLPAQRDFIAWQPAAVAGEAALVASEPLETWQDWLTFHRINQVTSVLPKRIDDAHFDFYGKTLNGTPQQRPRDQRAIGATGGALGDAVGKLYAAQYFPASSKADIQHMVKGILAAFDTRVAALTWMAPATKAEARRKIETMRVGIGYPETWRSYADYTVRANDPVANQRGAELAEYHHQIAKIGQPVDRGEWWMTPQTVNAVNLPLQNALNFPAAILQAPFYDPKADAASNYGSIGAVIGHEISHSFDNNGAEFDASGRLRNWWTPADLAHFKQQGAALAAQYGAYEPLPGVHLNGEQVLGENIADVAGLTAAYEAYHASLGGKPAPVIDGMTGDQRFFLAFAQSWRSKTRDKALRAQIATDGHAPGRYRAQTVRNLDQWYPAFTVVPGQALYLAPAKRVHVW